MSSLTLGFFGKLGGWFRELIDADSSMVSDCQDEFEDFLEELYESTPSKADVAKSQALLSGFVGANGELDKATLLAAMGDYPLRRDIVKVLVADDETPSLATVQRLAKKEAEGDEPNIPWEDTLLAGDLDPVFAMAVNAYMLPAGRARSALLSAAQKSYGIAAKTIDHRGIVGRGGLLEMALRWSALFHEEMREAGLKAEANSAQTKLQRASRKARRAALGKPVDPADAIADLVDLMQDAEVKQLFVAAMSGLARLGNGKGAEAEIHNPDDDESIEDEAIAS